MDITRRSDYACRILRAAHRNIGRFISVSEIADDEGIPYAFARSIQHDLVKSGFVKTNRGSHGGLTLNCDPDKVTLLEILCAVQGPVSIASCVDDEDICSKRTICEYHLVWCGADKLLQEYFASITLGELFEMKGDHPVVQEVLGKAFVDERGKKAKAKLPASMTAKADAAVRQVAKGARAARAASEAVSHSDAEPFEASEAIDELEALEA
ncbi:MAG: Rrf2 family transcriptional regulator [Coriobacteriaceae bacterium]|jgi:Rrf2 family protein|nr:Rrf2 family transcriptional regulator [Coriobacteriaceae bacterium]